MAIRLETVICAIAIAGSVSASAAQQPSADTPPPTGDVWITSEQTVWSRATSRSEQDPVAASRERPSQDSDGIGGNVIPRSQNRKD